MALADPQTLTFGVTDVDLPRTGVGPTSSVYSIESDSLNGRLTIGQTRGKRVRTQVRLDANVIVPDPLITGVSAQKSASVYLVVDRPLNGIDLDVLKENVVALCNYMTSDSAVLTSRILAGES